MTAHSALNKIARHLTYANVVATLALALAVGGVSYAATTLPRNSVGGTQLRANSVTTTKVKNSSLSIFDLSPASRRLLAGKPGPIGPAGPQGDIGAQGTQGIRGPSDLYRTASSSPSTFTLPVGTYLVLGTAASATPGTTCSLTVGTKDDTGMLPQGGTLPLTVQVTLNEPTLATLTCSAAGYTSRLYAIQVGSVTVL